MKEWFDSLEPRERVLVAGTGVLLILVIFYVAIVEPLYKGAAERQYRVEQKRADLVAMQQMEAQLGQLSDSAEPGVRPNAGSLVVLVNRTANEFDLASPRSQPSGQNSIRVTFRGQRFDRLVAWLTTLEQRHGLTIDSATFDRDSAKGIVNATLTLERGG